jgi:hypothetical protein
VSAGGPTEGPPVQAPLRTILVDPNLYRTAAGRLVEHPPVSTTALEVGAPANDAAPPCGSGVFRCVR